LIKISKKNWFEIGVEGGWISSFKYAQVDFDIPIPSYSGNNFLSWDNKSQSNKKVDLNDEEKPEKSNLQSVSEVAALSVPSILQMLEKKDQTKLLQGITLGGKQVTYSMIEGMSESQRNRVFQAIQAKHSGLIDDLRAIYSDQDLVKHIQGQRTSILGRVKNKLVPNLGRVAAGATGVAAGYFAGNYLFNKLENQIRGDQYINKQVIQSYPKGKSGFYAGSASLVTLVNSMKGINSVLDHLGKKVKEELDYASKNL
jgi:hypothetical protein